MKPWNLFSSLSNALNSSQCLCSVPAVQLCFCSIFYSFAVNVFSKIGEGWALGSWGQEWSVRICSCPFFRFTKQKLVFAKFCKHSTLQFYWIVNSSAALQFLKIPFFYQTLLNFAAYSTFEGHIACTECKGEVYCYWSIDHHRHRLPICSVPIAVWTGALQLPIRH